MKYYTNTINTMKYSSFNSFSLIIFIDGFKGGGIRGHRAPQLKNKLLKEG